MPSSNQGSNIIYPPYPHRIPFLLPPLPFTSHNSFSNPLPLTNFRHITGLNYDLDAEMTYSLKSNFLLTDNKGINFRGKSYHLLNELQYKKIYPLCIPLFTTYLFCSQDFLTSFTQYVYLNMTIHVLS